MKAVVHDRYGGPEVLRLADVERPVPDDDEILVRVRATTVNRTDCHRRAASPPVWRLLCGLRRPRQPILGSELAGEIAAVGKAVSGFAVGDEVFGLNPWTLGGHAEYACMPATGLVAHKPGNRTFEEAAATCDGALNALLFLTRAGLAKGQRVVVYGASGSIGTAAVQLARYFDAEVTAVCNTKNVETVRALGADYLIDYTKDDFTGNGQRYDLIFDAVGKQSFWRCRASLEPGGIFVATDHVQNILLSLLTSRTRARRVVFPIPPRYTQKDVLFLKQLMENGKYRAVIDRCYPLEQAVEATRYVETHQKTGNVVLTVTPVIPASGRGASGRGQQVR